MAMLPMRQYRGGPARAASRSSHARTTTAAASTASTGIIGMLSSRGELPSRVFAVGWRARRGPSYSGNLREERIKQMALVQMFH